MRYLLDTNICIYAIKRKSEKLLNKLHSLSPTEIGVSSITVAELEYGVAKSQKQEQNRLALATFLLPLEIVPFERKAAVEYGEVRAYLERKGNVIGAMDMLIAAHAKSLDVILVTNNTREFERVPDLKLEDWTI